MVQQHVILIFAARKVGKSRIKLVTNSGSEKSPPLCLYIDGHLLMLTSQSREERETILYDKNSAGLGPHPDKFI